MSEGFSEFRKRMTAAGVSRPAIAAFEHNYRMLCSGQTGLIPESSIEAVQTLPTYEQIAAAGAVDEALLSQTLVVKLNGGLGTSMGLERAKSLLQVKDDLTFLDLIARQILHVRTKHKAPLQFMLMNSFSTSADTLDFLKKYPELGSGPQLELMQSQVPKVDAQTLQPAVWKENEQLEWCPPGHGDFYTSLYASGALDRLLTQGVKYVFVSNSDNLGATLDSVLLRYFAASGLGFMMEVAARTPADRKGGHLAARDGKLLLRESAQCPPEDAEAFQDITKHRFFNTNNLWVRLDVLKGLLEQQGGFLPLPLIKNKKTVDPRQKNSPAVFQLETAMGAAIELFEKSGAVVVPRTRFAPVKTTSDLLALRSDTYNVTEDWRLVLHRTDGSLQPPAIDLDPEYYRLVDGLDKMTAKGVPSLKGCRELVVRGPIQFGAENVLSGKVSLKNGSKEWVTVPAGKYEGIFEF